MDFENCPERQATSSISYIRFPSDVLPLWLADMDCRSPEAITEALRTRVDHGVFGYTGTSLALRSTAVSWLRRRHGLDVEPSWLVFIPGIVCGINLFVRAFGNPGDSHLVNTPAYPPFLGAPANHGQRAVIVPLARSADGTMWKTDVRALEQAIDATTRSLFLCHPHNPTGRDWSVPELEEIAELCKRRNLVVMSDEIWADVVLDGKHVPFLKAVPSIADRLVMFTAPSKTFNVAGLGCSLAVIPDAGLREKFARAASGIVPHVNIFGLTACEAAWGGRCDDWIDQGLLPHLRKNRALLEQTLARLPKIGYTRMEATYLAWVDVSGVLPEGVTPGNASKWLAEKHKIGLGDGTEFGTPGWLRITMGVPSAMFEEGLRRFEAAFAARSK